MPIILHQLLMIVTMFVAFFVCGFVGWDRKDALVASGVPEWVVWASPLLAFFGSSLLFGLIPVRCPGCGWPTAFLRFSEQLKYRCLACRNIHLTMWGPRQQTQVPQYHRVWLPPLRLAKPNQQQRISFSGHVSQPCTLLLLLSPAPPVHRKSELDITVEARLTNEQGETLLRFKGPLKEWDSEPWWPSIRTSLGLRHPEWRDVALRGIDRFALEIQVHNVGPEDSFRTLRPALEFLHFGPALRSVGPHSDSDTAAAS